MPTLALNPLVQEIKSQASSEGTSGIRHYVKLRDAHLQSCCFPPPHTHQYNVHQLKHQQQEALGGSLLFCGWSPWFQTVPARVLLKLLEEELPLEVPQVLQDLRRQRLR